MFNLFFAGSGSKNTNLLKRELSCNQLLSQLNERKAILDWVDYLKNHPDCTSKLFIDSGAFSAHTKGKSVDVDDYIKFINEIDDYVFVFAQVDKIPGEFRKEKTPEQLASAPKESWDNYLYMVDKVKSRDKLLPVFHQGEDFKWLTNMLEYRHPDGKPIEYIGISPANDVHVNDKREWIERVFKTIKNSSNPNVKTHAFGMTSLNLLEIYPFTSADSTSWILYGAMGTIMTKYGTKITSDRRLKSPDHILNLPKEYKEEFEKYLDRYNLTLEDVMKTGDKREEFNLRFMHEWATNYTSKNNNTYKKSLL